MAVPLRSLSGMDLQELSASLVGIIEPERVKLGVATPEPFPEVRVEIERRTESGERGGLGFVYRDPDRATRPLGPFPWARSILVAAVGYVREGDGVASPDARSVARFADGDRYRDLRLVLERLSASLDADGHRVEVVFDDDRLVDRAVAVRSGVAWWGKSTMAITPGFGPWFLIGSVVTDAELMPTRPMRRSCGTCTACLPACPTGAIVAPGILDARRCLAALLQGRGGIPIELRDAVGPRIYGCDDCLTACPPGDPVLSSVGSEPTPDPRILLGAPDDDLLTSVAHWYVPGRRARFVRRNCLVAIGNTGGTRDLGLLAGYLGHPDSLLRAHAAWAIGAIGGPTAIAILDAAAVDETDGEVSAEIRSARAAADSPAPTTERPTIAS